ncbi:MAG: T9SS type A sorting domain-containing protein, partial [Candidatus Cloacimonetes bacterium]|nr:T9SS type A sorting domain-containing protein [Candidatus Cloacimonadota bacterium]
IPNNDWQDFPGAYTRDIKNRENQAWPWDILLNVENMLVDNCLNETIVLDRDVTAKLPAGYDYRLTDLNTGNSCDLRSGSMQLVLDIDAGDIASGMNPWLIPLRVEVTPVNGMGLQEMQQIVTTGNYPNPFNPSTTISYTLGKDAAVNLEIYNLKGQLVKRLVNENLPQGTYSAVWNGKDSQDRSVASGFYFYKLSAGDSTITRKILMMK